MKNYSFSKMFLKNLLNLILIVFATGALYGFYEIDKRNGF